MILQQKKEFCIKKFIIYTRSLFFGLKLPNSIFKNTLIFAMKQFDMKITKKHIEYYYPFVVSIGVILIVIFWLSNFPTFRAIVHKLLVDSVLTQIITIEATLFGFLLAVLALILQMNNKLVDTLKEFGRFKDLILFSKKAVYSTFVVIAFAILILLVKDLQLIMTVKLII